MFKKIVFLLASFVIANIAHARANNYCEAMFYTESKQLPGNFIALPGGIPHGKIHSQKSGEDCWAHAITELVEAHYFAKTGKQISLSPEYNLFWHLYFQIKTNLPRFAKIREQYNDTHPTERVAKLQKMFKDAYGLGPSRHVNVMLGFQVDVAAFVKEAIKDMEHTGVVPKSQFDEEISTDEKEMRIERGLAHFVGNYLIKAGHIERYAAEHDAKDGINTALFNDLVTSLMSHERAITQVPLRPDQEFKYRNRTTTPRQFLHEGVQFNPKDYRYVMTTKANRRQALRAIADSIRNHRTPVLVGMELFGEDDVWMKQQTQGLFSKATCDAACKEASGQHELMVVNYLFKDDPMMPTALIVQNSWGPIGHRDIDGNKALSPKKTGHVLISIEYLNRNADQVPWDLLISKQVHTKIPEP